MQMRSHYFLAVGALLLGLWGLMTQVSFAQSSPASQASSPTAVLLENVRILDGTAEQLSAPSNVLVVGNQIQIIDTRPLGASKREVKSIEHGQLMSEETARMIGEQDVWLSMQPFLDEEDRNPYPEGLSNRAS